MRRRVPAVIALAAMVLALALAVPASAATVTAQLGRTDRAYNHYGNPDLGRFHVAVAGELIDTDGNGIADSLGAATRMVEVRRVLRLQVDSLALQANIGGVWTTVNSAGPKNSGSQTTANVLLKTSAVGFCPHNTLTRSYRVLQNGSVRWSDLALGHQQQNSLVFTARMLASDPSCTAPPPPPATADVTVAKTDNAVEPVSNTAPASFSYVISATNNDPADTALGVRVTDTLPPELDLDGPLPADCVNDSDPAAEPDTIVCNFGSILPGETESRTINVTTVPGSFSDDAIGNTATVASSNDANPANNTSVDTVAIRPFADLSVAKRFSEVIDDDGQPDPAGIQSDDDSFIYVVRVTNNGPSTATSVVTVDSWPVGLENPVAAFLPVGCVFVDDTSATDADEVRCTTASLVAGGVEEYELIARTNGLGGPTLTNTATVSSATDDLDLTDNGASVTITIAATA
jgi:hypothetical protein